MASNGARSAPVTLPCAENGIAPSRSMVPVKKTAESSKATRHSPRLLTSSTSAARPPRSWPSKVRSTTCALPRSCGSSSVPEKARSAARSPPQPAAEMSCFDIHSRPASMRPSASPPARDIRTSPASSSREASKPVVESITDDSSRSPSPKPARRAPESSPVAWTTGRERRPTERALSVARPEIPAIPFPSRRARSRSLARQVKS